MWQLGLQNFSPFKGAEEGRPALYSVLPSCDLLTEYKSHICTTQQLIDHTPTKHNGRHETTIYAYLQTLQTTKAIAKS